LAIVESSYLKMFDIGETSVFAASFAVVGVIIYLRRIQRSGGKDNGKRYPPSIPALPVFGAIIRGGMAFLPEYFMKSAEKLGPVFSFKVWKRLVVVLNGYEAIYDAYVKHSEAFANRDSIWIEDNFLNPNKKGFMFVTYGDAYKKYHKLSLSILKEFGFGSSRVMETRILQEVESLNEEIRKQNGRSFDPKWPFSFAASNVVLAILFGKNFQQRLPNELSTIIKSGEKYFANFDLSINVAPIIRFLPTWRRKFDCMRESNQSLLNSIEVGIQFVKSNNTEPTFVGRFLEIEGTDYNHEDLLYVLRDLCFGGTETVPVTLEFAIVELANHPEIQDRFQREIDEMIPGDRLPSLDDKPRLPYTEAVILEVMRRHIIGNIFIRQTSVKATKVLDYDVPKGCLVVGNAYSAHMDAAFWKDPENFRPERFLDKDNNIINSNRMIGFGLGKRSCLGEILGRQSVFLFLTSLVQRFDIRPPEGQDSIIVKDVISFTTTPSHFKVRMIPRVKPTQCKG
jgi:cytochrome P450